MDYKKSKPSEEKIWKKYYPKEVLEAKIPECPIGEYIKNSNIHNLDRTAINYFDEQITYIELFKKIKNVEKALTYYGVKKGDKVSVVAPTTPETIYLLYAITNLGAVANLIDPRTNEEGLHNYLNDAKSELLFVLESNDCALKSIKAAKNTKVSEIFTIDPLESLTTRKKIVAALNTIKDELTNNKKLSRDNKKSLKEIIESLKYNKIDNCKNWNDFYIKHKNIDNIILPKYEKDRPAVIVYTGGTTGKSKGVVLSHDNINAVAFQCKYCGYDFNKTDKWLNVMPLFIAYGASNGLHLPLICGMEICVIPAFKPEKFGELTKKYSCNNVTCVPSHVDELIKSKKLKNADLSFVKSIIMGGDKANEEGERAKNNWLAEHGCKYKVSKGYGMSEVSAAVVTTGIDELNKIGSVGLPLPHTTIGIFNQDKNPNEIYSREDELGYYEEGEICITGPNIMLGYLNNEEEQKQVMKIHQDGTVWLHSQDIGYLDKDGALFFTDRMKNMTALSSGFKIYPSKIENIISLHKEVKNVSVVGVKDITSLEGKIPVAFIELQSKDLTKSDKNNIIEEIKIICQNNLAEYTQPYEIIIKNKLPLTKIGKIDRIKLANDYLEELESQKSLTKTRKLSNFNKNSQ